MSLGNTLRAAREACGISTSDLAARTHMLVQIVEGLENDDFRRIPAPIYGRGFVKLYCEAVKIDPKPLQAMFMEQFNRQKEAPANIEPPPKQSFAATGKAQVTQETAEVPAQPQTEMVDTPAVQTEESPVPEMDMPEFSPPEAEVQPAPVQPEPSMADLGELFAQPPVQAQNPQPSNIPPKRSYGDIFGQTYAAEPEEPKLSAADKFRNTMSNVSSGVFANVQKLPPKAGRIAAVSICALLTVALIIRGIFALYEATSSTAGEPTEKTADAAVAAPDVKSQKKNGVKSAVTPPAKKSSRKDGHSIGPAGLKSSGIEIPALYID
jgi:cytoskeletal protein RodZ